MIWRKDIREGMIALSRDGIVIGHVIEANDRGFIVRGEDGFTHPLLAYRDVDVVDGHEIRLLLSRDEFRGTETTEPLHTAAAHRAGAPASELRGGLHLSPRDLERARMDSAKFQHHAAPGTGDYPHEVTASSGRAEELRGGLGLNPRDLEQARMDSAKFQDHGRYDVGEERRAAAHEEDVVPRTSIPETDPNARIAAIDETVTPRRMAYDEEDVPPRTSIPETDPNARRS